MGKEPCSKSCACKDCSEYSTCKDADRGSTGCVILVIIILVLFLYGLKLLMESKGTIVLP